MQYIVELLGFYGAVSGAEAMYVGKKSENDGVGGCCRL
jgi:hypothetical protein